MFFIAFPCSFGANNEERESETAQKMAQVKEWGGVRKNYLCFVFSFENKEKVVKLKLNRALYCT